MKITALLNVSNIEFFNFLITQLLDDIKLTNHKTVGVDQLLEGYSYQKKYQLSKNRVETLQIIAGPMIENRYYELSYQSSTSKTKIIYDIKPLSESSISVTYHEESKPIKATGKLIYQFQKSFKQRRIRKKIIDNLKNFEQIIQSENLGKNTD